MKLTLEGRLGKMAYFEFSEDSELNLLILRHKTLFTAMRFSEVKPAAVTQEAHSGTWIFVGVYMNFMIQKCYNSRVRLSLAVYNSYQKKKSFNPSEPEPILLSTEQLQVSSFDDSVKSLSAGFHSFQQLSVMFVFWDQRKEASSLRFTCCFSAAASVLRSPVYVFF